MPDAHYQNFIVNDFIMEDISVDGQLADLFQLISINPLPQSRKRNQLFRRSVKTFGELPGSSMIILGKKSAKPFDIKRCASGPFNDHETSVVRDAAAANQCQGFSARH